MVLRWTRPQVTGSGQFEVAAFTVQVGSSDVGRVSCVATKTLTATLHGRMGAPEPAVLQVALKRYALARAEQLLGSTAGMEAFLGQGALTLTLDSFAIEEVVALALSGKACDKMLRVAGERWCVAAAPGDETAHWTIDGHSAAPTSIPMCEGCAVPDSHLRCSRMTHPQVIGIHSAGGRQERMFSWATCDAGYQDRVVGTPSGCVPEGHDCWERHIVPPDDSPSAVGALAVLEGFDHLSDLWRLAFGHRLLNLLSAVDAALIAREVTGRAEFVDSLRALAKVINTLVVEDRVLTEVGGDPSTKGSLARIESVTSRTDGSETRDSIAEAACAALRSVIRLDNAYSHDTGALPQLWPLFGLASPPDNWGLAWNATRERALSAVRRLIGVVRSIVDSPQAESDTER